MIGNMEWFSDSDECFRLTIKLGNVNRIVLIGKGNIRMQVNEFTLGNEEGDKNGNEEGGNNDDTANSIKSSSSFSESHEDESPNVVEGNVRRTPSYLEDYEIGEGLSDEDNLIATTMLTKDDLLSFEESSKSNKLRDAISPEIE
ncbi:hypothetical protein KIW84_045540 [Lathyrus oleraceus]|uniref:Uncharacterized protein n=1 Tax=Pisum sativum TaxID=3888 RepID=A0A9D5ARW4_PEA|nr:hypothetical protein KIW84_045540 [Pisum sativum]